MVHLVEMQVESALFFESVEEIYERVFRVLRPRTQVPSIAVRYRRYANANSRIRLVSGTLQIDISDLLERAPAPIQEALASILLSKLFGKAPDRDAMARYRRYLNRTEIRKHIHRVKQERGRKAFRDPVGKQYDLKAIFEDLNLCYFDGLMARPELGWSIRQSRTTLGHYDPSHHVIVLTNLLDSSGVPEVLVRYVMFHEMLHLCYPTEHRGARRCVHTADFKKAERKFIEYAEALTELKRFAQRTAER